MLFLLMLLILLSWLEAAHSVGRMQFLPVACSNCGNTSNFANHTYLIVGGLLKLLVEPLPTLKALIEKFNYSSDVLPLPEHALLTYSLGKDVPLIERKTYSLDESIEVELKLVHALQDVEIVSKDLAVICGFCKNPTVVKWNGLPFVSYETRNTMRKLNLCGWNTTLFPRKANEVPPGLEWCVERKDTDMIVHGADVRALPVNDSLLYLVYEDPIFHISYSILKKFPNNSIGTTGTFLIKPDWNSGYPQKNWIPFIYNDSLLMIQSIQPLRVVKVYPQFGSNFNADAVTFSLSHAHDLHWPYGDIRGGTNPIRVGNQFLAIFHTRTILPYNKMVTFVCGAYTFSASPPFKLTGISRFPIYIDALYIGPWFGRSYDYVVYPTGLISAPEEDLLYLTVGLNDKMGFIAKLTMSTLLQSLRPLNKHSFVPV